MKGGDGLTTLYRIDREDGQESNVSGEIACYVNVIAKALKIGPEQVRARLTAGEQIETAFSIFSTRPTDYIGPVPDLPGDNTMRTLNTKRAGRTTKKAEPKVKRAKGTVSGLDAAYKFLKSKGGEHNSVEIAKGAVKLGWETSGKTPHATLSAQIYQEIVREGKKARFVKTKPGHFAAK